MILTERQSDALTELINIAFGRTASALSALTGQRVLLEPPEVSVLRLESLAETLGRYVPGDVASIHQDFTGPISGDAMLILSHRGAVALSALLTDQPEPADHLDDSAREVLTEVGNILLNACLSMFGDLLHVRVNFSVPRLRVDTVDALLSARRSDSGVAAERQHAIVVSMAFRVKGSSVAGYLALVLGVASLTQLVAEVESWEARTSEPPA